LKIFKQVIDEIDGALGDGKGAVEVILKMVLLSLSFFSLAIKYLMQAS
jgi:hypothetical protein